jgi:phage FluMu gp28-like protein
MKPPALPLYAYQKRWIEDASRFKIGMQARQTGKTFGTTLELVRDCLQAEAAGKWARWVILSRGERQAKEAMEEGVKRHAQAMSVAIKALDSEYRSEAGVYKQHEVILPGGSRITALPANPDTARGFSANVFLDELPFITIPARFGLPCFR